MMRKLTVVALAALACAVPGQAEDGGKSGKELRITGTVVRAGAEAVAVENAVGDAVLTCAVPPRLAEKAAALKAGDRVRMTCVRFKGRKAQLVKVVPVAPREHAARKEAVGPIAELGDGAIVVQGHARVACTVPAEKRAKLDGLKLGDKVKIVCVDGQLAGLERYAPEKPAGEEVRVYGRIAELSREAVTVRGEAGSLTCRVPAAMAEKLARFAVGDAVKMMCRGTELTYLERTA